MWFAEDPWPPLLILASLATVFGIAWNATRRGLYLLITLGLVVLGGVVFLAEELILTQGEQVEEQVHALADAVEKGEGEKVVAFISPQAVSLRNEIGSRMEDVDIEEGLRITDLQVTVEDSGTRGVSHFRANGMGTWKKTLSHSFATRWNLTWQKEGEAWKVVQIEQLDPIKGDVINEWRTH